jgi:molybdopterin converting factor small subunit
VLIKIYYYNVFGKGTIPLHLQDQATIHDALHELTRLFGDAFEVQTGQKLDEVLKTSFNWFLNDRYLNIPSDFNQKLTNEDTMVILRPVSGG